MSSKDSPHHRPCLKNFLSSSSSIVSKLWRPFTNSDETKVFSIIGHVFNEHLFAILFLSESGHFPISIVRPLKKFYFYHNDRVNRTSDKIWHHWPGKTHIFWSGIITTFSWDMTPKYISWLSIITQIHFFKNFMLFEAMELILVAYPTWKRGSFRFRNMGLTIVVEFCLRSKLRPLCQGTSCWLLRKFGHYIICYASRYYSVIYNFPHFEQ